LFFTRSFKNDCVPHKFCPIATMPENIAAAIKTFFIYEF